MRKKFTLLKKLNKAKAWLARKNIYHDLDHLAGSWSAETEKTFKENTKFFDKIDKILWK